MCGGLVHIHPNSRLLDDILQEYCSYFINNRQYNAKGHKNISNVGVFRIEEETATSSHHTHPLLVE